jgi:hypothetical protein
MKYLGYGPCYLRTPGMPVSLLGSHVEPDPTPLAFPVASGSTCPLLPVSPVTNPHVFIIQCNYNFHNLRNCFRLAFRRCARPPAEPAKKFCGFPQFLQTNTTIIT